VRDGAHHPIGRNSIPHTPYVNEKDFAFSVVKPDGRLSEDADNNASRNKSLIGQNLSQRLTVGG
jgi:hypothetical protein